MKPQIEVRKKYHSMHTEFVASFTYSANMFVETNSIDAAVINMATYRTARLCYEGLMSIRKDDLYRLHHRLVNVAGFHDEELKEIESIFKEIFEVMDSGYDVEVNNEPLR